MFNRNRFRRDDIIDLVDLTSNNVFISIQNGSLTATLQKSCSLAFICVYNIVTSKWLSAICLALATSNSV